METTSEYGQATFAERLMGASELLDAVEANGFMAVMQRYGCTMPLACYIDGVVAVVARNARDWARQLKPLTALGTTYAHAYAVGYIARNWARTSGMEEDVAVQIGEELTALQLHASRVMGAVPGGMSPFSEAEVEQCEDAFTETLAAISESTGVEFSEYFASGEIIREVLSEASDRPNIAH